jgi:mannose-1-phosphate guanylyltransferase/mannose-6-phosphate isomerase
MAQPIIPLIMCGGAGTRLWPASRENRPKQFLPLLGPLSTFQETLRRISDQTIFDRPIVVTNDQYRFLVTEQIAAIGGQADILLEPTRRDSGPAIVAGAEYALRRTVDPVIVALAADHVVSDPEVFVEVCVLADKSVRKEDKIIMFGVPPTRPATEYGYIRPGLPISSGLFAIEKFVEKPDVETATRYMSEGYLWNSGNFVFRAETVLQEYRRFEPDSAAAVAAAVEISGADLGFVTLDRAAFARAAPKSIDYALMERTARAAVMPVSFGWSDVGSWQAVWELSERDSDGNAAQAPAVFVDAHGSYVSSGRQLIALLGVDNVVVVATEDAVLVARREDEGRLRRVVSELKTVAPTLTEDHLKVHRPWGSYQSLDMGERYQVKRIVVKPGARLSLQMHHHRAEHWVVVRGTARVQIDNRTEILHENESVFVPSGSQHRLENPGKIDLELIEVQTGSYLGEDDIVRIEDDFHRTTDTR